MLRRTNDRNATSRMSLHTQYIKKDPHKHLYLNEDNVTEKDFVDVRLNLLTETERDSCSREESDLKGRHDFVLLLYEV